MSIVESNNKKNNVKYNRSICRKIWLQADNKLRNRKSNILNLLIILSNNSIRIPVVFHEIYKEDEFTFLWMKKTHILEFLFS